MKPAPCPVYRFISSLSTRQFDAGTRPDSAGHTRRSTESAAGAVPLVFSALRAQAGDADGPPHASTRYFSDGSRSPVGCRGHTCVFGGSPRALSADLNDQLAAGSSLIDVIVHGHRDEVDALAQRYNVRVKRYMKSGVVFQVTAVSWQRFSRTTTLDHLSAMCPFIQLPT